MRTLGNILWHVPFMGFLSALGVFLIGGILTITVVGAPIGLGLIQLSKFLLTPFSSAMVSKSDVNVEQNLLWKSYGFIVRLIYFPVGLIFAIITIFQIIGLFFSIVGIPMAIILSKSVGTFFNPVNKVCVPHAVASVATSRKARAQVDEYLG